MKQNARVSPRLVILIVLGLFLLNLSALAWIGWPVIKERGLAGLGQPLVSKIGRAHV